MTCYIVSFQVSSEKSLTELKKQLKSYDGYCPIDETLWAILSEKSAIEIRDYLKGVVQSNDRIFVIRSGTEAAWFNTYGEANSQWLKNNL